MSRDGVARKSGNMRFFGAILPVLVFALFIVAISWKTFPSKGVLGYGDYPFFWPGGNLDGSSTWVQSNLGASWVGNMFSFPVLGLLPRALKVLGANAALSSYLLNYLPVYLLCLATFFVTKKVSRSLIFAYCAALFIILNNFILEQFLIWPGSYFWNAIGILFAVYFSWRINTEGLTPKLGLELALSSLLILHAFLWFLYVSFVVCFLVFYLVSHRTHWKSLLTKSLGIVAILVAFHAYWILPFIYNAFRQTAAEAYNGNLGAVLQGYKSIATYFNILGFRQYFIWSPNAPQYSFHNSLQYIVVYALYGCMVWTIFRRKVTRYMLFLLTVIVVYSNFALGPNSLFTGSLWQWMFDSIPSFGFFRSFTRVSIVTLVALLMYFAVYVRHNSRRTVLLTCIAITALSIFSFRIYFTGDLNGLMANEKVPAEYLQLNEKYLKRSEGRETIITYPNIGYEATTWGINRNVDVFPQQSVFKQTFFSEPVAFNTFTVFLNQRNELFSEVFAFNDDFQFKPSYDEKLSQLNVRYVLIQKDLYNVLQPGIRVPYKKYIEYFSSNPLYVLREDNDSFAFYEFKQYKPLVDGRNVQFQSIFDTMYRVKISHVTERTDLTFLQNFHEGWKLYVQRPSTESWCVEVNHFQEDGVVECRHRDDFVAGSVPSLFFSRTVFDDSHTTKNSYANSWVIDPEYIKYHFPSSMYTTNPDGSIDLEFVLYFRPQSLFAIGVIITIVTALLVGVGYCVILWRSRKIERTMRKEKS